MKKKKTLTYYIFWIILEVIVSSISFLEMLFVNSLGWTIVHGIVFLFMLGQFSNDLEHLIKHDYR